MTMSSGRLPQHPASALANELRAVVLAAQVGGDEMAQAGVATPRASSSTASALLRWP